MKKILRHLLLQILILSLLMPNMVFAADIDEALVDESKSSEEATSVANNEDIIYSFDYANDIITLQMTADEGAESATCYIENPNHMIVYIGSVPIVNGNYTLSFGLDELVQGKYTGRLRTQQNKVVEILFELNNVKNIEKNISGGLNEEFDLIITGENLSLSASKSYVIKYDSEKVKLLDLCSLTYDKELSNGLVLGTSINIIDVNEDAGLVEFEINDNYTGRLSGVLNAFKFVCLEPNTQTSIFLEFRE